MYEPGDKLDRQYGRLDEIRLDHVKRYLFAASRVGGARLLDMACGCGYGSWLLHIGGNLVTSVDVCAEAIAYAKEHYPGPQYLCQRAEDTKGEFDVLVSFETIEHLPDPLKAFSGVRAKTLIASVPNEDYYPFDPKIFAGESFPHLRHYRPAEFESLLNDAGYKVIEWWCQKDKNGGFFRGVEGKFVIALCERDG